jgi:hypothetical protein
MNLNILKLRCESEDSRSAVAHAGIMHLTLITSHGGKILKIDILGRRKRYLC